MENLVRTPIIETTTPIIETTTPIIETTTTPITRATYKKARCDTGLLDHTFRSSTVTQE